jgi:3-oxoacyl-[acyl-carrier protein] reductase
VSNPLGGMIALVTGAHQGIGAACALALGDAGAEVVCVDLQSCEETAASLTKLGRRAICIAADVGDEASVYSLFREVRTQVRRLDILVHCAGVIDERPLLETTAEQFDRVIDVNLRGTFLVGREALRLMKEQGGEARVILIASDLAYYGRKSFSAYVASKHGVLGLTRCWAREFAPDIMINAICPGPIDTPMLRSSDIGPDWAEKERDIPLRRLGQPEEIGALAAFLAGPGGRFFTGQGVGPNGGSVTP